MKVNDQFQAQATFIMGIQAVVPNDIVPAVTKP
jgi:hypothetical protein